MWKLFDRYDDKFVSQAQDPTQCRKMLNYLRFTRVFFLFLLVLAFVLEIALSIILGGEITIVSSGMLFPLLFVIGYVTDTQIKMIKLFLSTQQKES